MTDTPLHPPQRWLTLREFAGYAELPGLLTNVSRLKKQPRGSGEPVMLVPGILGGDGSLGLLRAYLRYLGYRTMGWGQGRNMGQPRKTVPEVIQRVERVYHQTGQKVSLVGCSLGGVISREVAREKPEWVDCVVTFGTPVVGAAKYTALAKWYEARGLDLDRMAREVADRDKVPIKVPVTAIFSRNDGIVHWRASIDKKNEMVRHVEVEGTHVGMMVSPDVFVEVAQALARKAE